METVTGRNSIEQPSMQRVPTDVGPYDRVTHINTIIDHAGLIKAVYVWQMSRWKKRIGPEAKERAARGVVDACAKITRKSENVWPR